MSGEMTFEDLPFEIAKLCEERDPFAKLRRAWVEDGKEFLVGHGLNDTDDHEQTESECQPVRTIKPVDAVCQPAEEDVFHIGGGGKEQERAAEPFLEVLFEFFADFLNAEDFSQCEAEERYRDQPEEDAGARAHDRFDNSSNGQNVQQEAENVHFFCTPRSLGGRSAARSNYLLQCIRAILRGEQYSPQKYRRQRTAGEKCGSCVCLVWLVKRSLIFDFSCLGFRYVCIQSSGCHLR